MGPLILLFACFCLVLSVPVVLFLLTYIFRLSCTLCGLPKPGVMVSSGKLFVSWVMVTIAYAILRMGVLAICQAVGVPRWEADPAAWLLVLPVDLVLSSAIHAGLTRIRFGKAVEVWFVQRLILLSILVVILFIIALVLAIQMLAG